MESELDHIGILVSNLEQTLRSLVPHGWPVGEVEEFPSEGTREVFVGPVGATGRLLLLQAIGEGPYGEAMAKRGPGLHHMAINVPDVPSFLDQVSGSGWYLHPTSLATYKKFETVWLSRPGVPMLVEVVETISRGTSEQDKDGFVTRIEVPLPEDKPRMADSLGLGRRFQPSPSHRSFITIGGTRGALEEFLKIDG
jgi:catechol 2,3-dioxygenase-like lactoylglutathione lyase family enzyme